MGWRGRSRVSVPRLPADARGVGGRAGRRSDSAGLRRAARPRRRAADDAAGGAARVRGDAVVREAQGRGVKINLTGTYKYWHRLPIMGWRDGALVLSSACVEKPS